MSHSLYIQAVAPNREVVRREREVVGLQRGVVRGGWQSMRHRRRREVVRQERSSGTAEGVSQSLCIQTVAPNREIVR